MCSPIYMLVYSMVLGVSSCCVVCLDYVDSFVSVEAIDLNVWVNNYLINLCLRMKVNNSVTSDYKNCHGISLSL
jgi:hypothetical protein